MIVEADGVGQIADPALDLERLARRVEPEHADSPRRNLGQAEQHQDGRGLAGAVRTEQAKHLTLPDGKADVIDRAGAAVTLGQAFRNDDGFGRGRYRVVKKITHRRPNLATAPSIRSSATPITPAPTMPHTVDVATEMRNWLDALSPRALARTVTM